MKSKKIKLNKKAIILTIAFLFSFSVIIGATIAFVWGKDIPPLDLELLRGTENPVSLYDKNGKFITNYSETNQSVWVTKENIPEKLKNAFIAVEDKRFYSHNGVDYIRLTRVVLNRLVGKGGGGSTITQQLVKNVYLTPEKTLKRKYQEVILARRIEKVLSKDEIFEAYVNSIYFGGANYGVKAAAKDYFNKDLDELTTREMAMLAGLINAPSRYNPRENMYGKMDMTKTNRRTDVVLLLMKRNGYLTEEEYKSAMEEAIFVQEEVQKPEFYKFPHFTEYVIHEVKRDLLKKKGLEINKNNLDKISKEILSKGYKIHTSMDLDIQKTIQGIISNWADYPKMKNARAEAAGVIIENKTGNLVAMVGGRKVPEERWTFNRATMSIAPVASIIKPLSVYIPAFEKGFSPESIEYNYPVKIEGFDQNVSYPRGHLEKENQKPFTYKEALSKSLNVVPARILMEEIGTGAATDFLSELGISKKKIQDTGMGLVMGTMGTDMLSMARAYSTIPNKGEFIGVSSYIKVEDEKGNVILEADEFKEKKQVFSKATAYQINEALEDVMVNGTGTPAYFPNMNIAGKTGTHQDRSVTFAGYTPYYTSAVWIGGDNYEAFTTDASGGKTAGKLWKDYMSVIHKPLQNKKIFDEKPEDLGLTLVKIEKISGLRANPDFKYKDNETVLGYFLKDHVPEISNFYRQVKIDNLTGYITEDEKASTFQKTLIVIPKEHKIRTIPIEMLKKTYPYYSFVFEEDLATYNDYGLTPEQVDAKIEKRNEEIKREKEKEKQRKIEEEKRKEQEEKEGKNQEQTNEEPKTEETPEEKEPAIFDNAEENENESKAEEE